MDTNIYHKVNTSSPSDFDGVSIDDISRAYFQNDIPQLSGSVESVDDNVAVEHISISAPLEISPSMIIRRDSSSIIKDTNLSLSAPVELAPQISTIIERRFWLLGAHKELTSNSTNKPAQSKKQPTFVLGVSSFSSEHVPTNVHDCEKCVPLGAQHMQASLANHVTTRTVRPHIIDSNFQGSYIDEDTIGDDEDDAWEDCDEESVKSSIDDKFFKRVDSSAHLPSRRSLITLMLEQGDRAKPLGNHVSQSTSAIPQPRPAPNDPSLGVLTNDSDEAPLMMGNGRQPMLKPIVEAARIQPTSMATNQVNASAAMSLCTTRRNMLATELSKSLRRGILWERSQKTSTANAVLKRRNTSQDPAVPKRNPERASIKQSEDASSGNQFQAHDNGYHYRCW